MIIGYSMPAVSNIIIGGGSWLTADNGSALVDGQPARRTRMQWSAGTTLDSYMQIALTFTAGVPLRVLALLGSTLPAGVRVDFLGDGGDGLGGTCNNSRTVMMPDGSAGTWAIARENDAVESGCWVRIHNDCNGVPWATNSTIVDVGELVTMPGVDVDHGLDWEEGFEDPADRTRTRAGQLNTIRRSAYRTYAVSLIANSAACVRQGGLCQGMDWAQLRAALAGDARCVAIPRWGMAAALDSVAINATALYGTGRIDSIRHLGGDWYGSSAQFEEVPAR